MTKNLISNKQTFLLVFALFLTSSLFDVRAAADFSDVISGINISSTAVFVVIVGTILPATATFAILILLGVSFFRPIDWQFLIKVIIILAVAGYVPPIILALKSPVV